MYPHVRNLGNFHIWSFITRTADEILMKLGMFIDWLLKTIRVWSYVRLTSVRKYKTELIILKQNNGLIRIMIPSYSYTYNRNSYRKSGRLRVPAAINLTPPAMQFSGPRWFWEVEKEFQLSSWEHPRYFRRV